MGGGVHRGRSNKEAPVGTILLLMCMLIPASTLLQPSEEQKCRRGDYLTEDGICCDKCLPGTKLVKKCHAAGQRSTCADCPAGQYTDQMNYTPNCRQCRRCKPSRHEVEVSKCEIYQNTVCRCEDGYYKDSIDSEIYQCLKCSQCGPDEKPTQPCTPERNTVCECKENYYRAHNNKCELCKNCTSECKHHCPSPSTRNDNAPGTGMEYLITIVVVPAVVVVLLALVIVITHKVTKRLTKKKLLKSSSEPSDDSPDSCKQVLIHGEGPSNNNSLKAAPPTPVSEQEQLSNLPDCVPLEIKIPDLIYTVLDLVPVLQVKQLVRSLGVKDTEIEQAELDYRSCREAHYQMLRVWAERGSRAGGMLHWPLLQELLNELKKMHLGQAAEELETKYSIQ